MLRVLVTNIKGGCGKTTIATNLAAAFAVGGFATGLVEVDRQRSSLAWLKLRDGHGRPITGLDWRKEMVGAPPELRRLVIDAPANLRMRHVDELIDEADLVVVPVLASVFDEGSTERFLAKLEELKPIRVNSLHPGFIITPLTEAQDTSINDYVVSQTPMGRAGQPHEIAQGAVFLASDESSFMTGSELVIDGGYLAQ